LSIGGISVRDKKQANIIRDYQLVEISLTPMPANFDTFKSVKIIDDTVCTDCLTKAFNYIIKEDMEDSLMSESTEEKIETKEQDPTTIDTNTESNVEDVFTRKDAIDLFNELMAEKEQTIADEISDKLQPQIQNIVTKAVDSVLETKEQKPQEEPEKEPEEPEESEEEPVEEEKPEDKKTLDTSKIDTKKLEIPANIKNTKADMAERNISKPQTFLNSETRDMFGRNKKYL